MKIGELKGAIREGLEDIATESVPKIVKDEAKTEAREVIVRESREAVNKVVNNKEVEEFLKQHKDVLEKIPEGASLEDILKVIGDSGEDGAKDVVKAIEAGRDTLRKEISSSIRDSPGFKTKLKGLPPKLQEEILERLGGRSMLEGGKSLLKDQSESGLRKLFSVDTFKKAGAAVGVYLVGERLMQDFAAQDTKVCQEMCLDSSNTKQSKYTDNGRLKDPNCKAKPPNVPDCKTWCGTGPKGACSDVQCGQRGEIECGGILNTLKCGVDNISDAAKSGIDLWKQYGVTILRFIYITAFVIGLYLVWTFLKTFIVTVPARKVKGWRDAAIRRAGGDVPARNPQLAI